MPVPSKVTTRPKRDLTQDEARELLALGPKDYTLSKIKELFADFDGKPARFLWGDRLTVPAGTFGNSAPILTVAGRIVFNKVVIFWDPAIAEAVGYQNSPMTASAISALDDELARLTLEEKVTPSQHIDYIDRIQWLGFSTAHFTIPSLDSDAVVPLKAVTKEKKRLVAEHADAIAKDDVYVVGNIEKQLMALAKEELSANPSMKIYSSGAKGKFENNYKNSSIMRGAVRRNGNGKFQVSTSNLVEGIGKEEYPMYADQTVAASFGRAVGTREGGYEAKKLSGAFQTVTLGEPGSDCFSNCFSTVDITQANRGKFAYRWVQSGKDLVLLDSQNLSAYVGKTVKMRSPMFCRSEKLCSKCAGDLYYRLGIANVGMLSSRVGTRILNLSLKAFHDSSIKTAKIDISRYII